MSDLQIGLLILGLLVIGGVVGFNWLQERRFRQRAEHGFQRPDADVLLGGDDSHAFPSEKKWETRIDPHLEPRFRDTAPEQPVTAPETQEPAPEKKATVPEKKATAPGKEATAPETRSTAPAPSAQVARGVSRVESMPDVAIHYVAEIRAGEVIPAGTIETLEGQLQQTGCKCQLFGYNYHTRAWERIAGPENWYTSIKLFVQLVDRGGSVTADQVENIAMLMRSQADEISGICEAPTTDEVMTRALSLEDFCLDVDIIVGLSVAARPGQVLHGTQLRALAESSGLQLGSNGVFVMPDEHGGALFTMDNQESNPFDAAELKSLTTRGVTFLLDVPRTANGVKVLNRMIGVCKQFAESLDAVLCDDNRQPLNDSGLEKIRNQLRSTYEAMDGRGIPAGSATARQLFS